MTHDLVEDFMHIVTSPRVPKDWAGNSDLNQFYRFVKLEASFLQKRPHLVFQVSCDFVVVLLCLLCRVVCCLLCLLCLLLVCFVLFVVLYCLLFVVLVVGLFVCCVCCLLFVVL